MIRLTRENWWSNLDNYPHAELMKPIVSAKLTSNIPPDTSQELARQIIHEFGGEIAISNEILNLVFVEFENDKGNGRIYLQNPHARRIKLIWGDGFTIPITNIDELLNALKGSGVPRTIKEENEEQLRFSEEEIEHLRRGDKIAAIKAYRNRCHVSLAEAKREVEEFAKQKGLWQ